MLECIAAFSATCKTYEMHIDETQLTQGSECSPKCLPSIAIIMSDEYSVLVQVLPSCTMQFAMQGHFAAPIFWMLFYLATLQSTHFQGNNGKNFFDLVVRSTQCDCITLQNEIIRHSGFNGHSWVSSNAPESQLHAMVQWMPWRIFAFIVGFN